MLFAFTQVFPDTGFQIEVQSGEDHAPLRRGGDGGQNIGGGRRGPGRTGGDHGLLRRALAPGRGQQAQQFRSPPSRIDQTHGLKPPGPGLDGQTQELRRRLPVFGQIALDQGGDPGHVLDLFQLAGIKKAAQRIGHLQRSEGRQAGPEILHDHPRHFEPAGQGGDGDVFLADDRRLTFRGEAASAPFAYMGVHICRPDYVAEGPEGPFSLSGFWRKSAAAGRLYGCVLDGDWMHVGDPQARDEAEVRLAQGG